MKYKDIRTLEELRQLTGSEYVVATDDTGAKRIPFEVLADEIGGAVPVIEETAAGEMLTLSGSAAAPLRSLRICGKSTQGAEPSPEAPQEIVSLSGKMTVFICGKNLAYFSDQADVETNGITWRLKDGVFTATGTTIGTSSSDRAFLCDLAGLVGKFAVSGSSENIAVIAAITKSGTTEWYTEEAFELDGTEDSVLIYCQITGANITVNETVRPMVNVGETAEPWVQGVPAQEILITTPDELPGIAVDTGGNYTDASGQQWICDEVDLARGVYVQRLSKKVFDGSSFFGVSTHTNGQPYARFTQQSKLGGAILSNRYIGGVWSDSDKHVYTLPDNVVITDSRFTDTETAKSILAAERPEILFELAEPVEIALTAAEIAAYKALRTNYPETTILMDSGAGMVAVYAADTKLYINKRISEATAPQLVDRTTGEAYQLYVSAGSLMLEKVEV